MTFLTELNSKKFSINLLQVILCIVICFFYSGIGYAQQDEPYIAKEDTTSAVEKGPGTIEILFTGKPGKALGYSLLLPGAGQIYNRKYWKAPLVWGGVGLFVYYIDQYTRREREFTEEIDRRVMGETLNFQPYSVDALRRFRDITNTNKQYSYLGLAAVYLLSAIEAFVDRHLMEFDVGEDLSLRIRPATFTNGAGISFILTLP